MSYEIYICDSCGGPIYFPYGNLMHLGTGWYCWQDQQRHEEAERAHPNPPGKFFGKTTPRLLQKLVDEACRRYANWMAKDSTARLIPFLRMQLRAGRGDVVHKFFQYLIAQPPPLAGAVIRTIMATPEWHRFARRALNRARLAAKNRTRPAVTVRV